MRRPVIIVTLLLPFVFAALPLLAVFVGGNSPAYAGGTVAVSPSVAAVATTTTAPSDNASLAQTVSQGTQDNNCVGSSTGVQG